MKSGESAGIDEISMNLIKSVIDCIAEPLSVIINLCLTSGIYPDQLKIAKVCPIFKEGSKNELANYRPISIIPSFSKLFEKIISNRLLSYINKFEIFNPAQYGFRKKHSTYMAMLNLYDKVSEAVDKNEFSIGVFIDLSKAFDTINHDILIRKLEMYGIRGIPNLLIKSYLNNRKQYVNYNNCTSTLKPIQCGVPQGSILGPLLFLLYINDMTYCCKYLHFLLFADDTNIFYSNPDLWQLMHIVNGELDILSDWFKANKLSLNIKKTNYMMFGYKKIMDSCPINNTEFCIKIDDVNISEVEYTKFLGIFIDKKLTWQRHVSYISSKIARSLYVLNRLKFKLPINALTSLYFCLIYPHLIYCNILWGCAANSILNELFFLQKRAVRIICKCGYLTHSDPLFKNLGLLKVSDLYKHCCALFAYKFKNNYLPSVCDSLLSINIRSNNDMSYNLRAVNEFTIPFARTSIRERCITIRGAKIWSSLDEDIKNSLSISIFKEKLAKLLIDEY